MKLEIAAYAKINLTLDVLYKREDGYHELKTIMQTIDLADQLLFTSGGSGIEIITDHPNLPTGSENLIYQAAELLAEEYGVSADLKVKVKKNIPVSAGLAGGSTNAAATLLAADKLWNLGLSQSELVNQAAKLGADVPFCLVGGTKLATGTGTDLQELPSINDLNLVVVNPPFEVSTAEVYNYFAPSSSDSDLRTNQLKSKLKEIDYQQLLNYLGNDLEKPALELYSQINTLKQKVERLTDKAIVSGSGPTILGFVGDKVQAQKTVKKLERELNSNYQITAAKTVDCGCCPLVNQET